MNGPWLRSAGARSHADASPVEQLPQQPQQPLRLSLASACTTAGGVALGGAVVIAILAAESVTYGSSPTQLPGSCVQPPLDCWDALAKANGGIKCPRMTQDTLVRGHLLPKGTRTCYKAIYFNAEPATLHVLAWLLAWAALVLKAAEHAAAQVATRTLRLSALAAAAVAQPSLWYGFALMMHYTNDFWYTFYTSQLFFTLSEALLFASIAVLLDRRRVLPAGVWYAATGTALYHVLQLLLDEGAATFVRGERVGRMAHMLAGDVAAAVTLWRAGVACHGETRRGRVVTRVMLVVVAEWLLFNLAFGDGASTGLSWHIQAGKAAMVGIHIDARD